MTIPRREHPADGTLETGRVNQKRRTRAAIVGAAQDLLAQGVTPTVAQAAETALVSRTTAYRYFPSQESLLLEVAVNVDVDDVEALVARPVDESGAADRAAAVLALFNRHVLDDEVRYRTVLRLYLDLWLTAVAHGDDVPVVREGRRRHWLAEALEPVRDHVGDDDLQRLIAGLSVLGGAEAVVVLRDICRLDPGQALAVTDWAARALIHATVAAPHRA